jgi:hypothetical protein
MQASEETAERHGPLSSVADHDHAGLWYQFTDTASVFGWAPGAA